MGVARVTEEIEAKFEVSPEDFGRLLEAGELRTCVDQLNVYYDHARTLADRSATFRIRVARGTSPKMTLKVESEATGATRKALEIEQELPRRGAPKRFLSVATDLPDVFTDRLLHLGLITVQRVGWMRTRRRTVALGENGAFELDEVSLPGGIRFYEAEVEVANAALREALVAAICRVAMSARPSRLSKYQRFAQAIAALETAAQAGKAVAAEAER